MRFDVAAYLDQTQKEKEDIEVKIRDAFQEKDVDALRGRKDVMLKEIEQNQNDMTVLRDAVSTSRPADCSGTPP